MKEDLDEELVAINHFGRLAAPAFFVSIGVPLESAAEATSSRYARSLLRPLLGDTRFLNLYEHARGLSQIFLDEAETVRGVLSHGGEVARRVGR